MVSWGEVIGRMRGHHEACTTTFSIIAYFKMVTPCSASKHCNASKYVHAHMHIHIHKHARTSVLTRGSSTSVQGQHGQLLSSFCCRPLLGASQAASVAVARVWQATARVWHATDRICGCFC